MPHLPPFLHPTPPLLTSQHVGTGALILSFAESRAWRVEMDRPVRISRELIMLPQPALHDSSPARVGGGLTGGLCAG